MREQLRKLGREASENNPESEEETPVGEQVVCNMWLKRLLSSTRRLG